MNEMEAGAKGSLECSWGSPERLQGSPEGPRGSLEVSGGARGTPRELRFPEARDPLAAWMGWLGRLRSMGGPMGC